VIAASPTRLKTVTASVTPKKKGEGTNDKNTVAARAEEYHVDMKGAESIRQSVASSTVSIPKNLNTLGADPDGRKNSIRLLAGTGMDSPSSKIEDRLE